MVGNLPPCLSELTAFWMIRSPNSFMDFSMAFLSLGLAPVASHSARLMLAAATLA